MAMKLSQEDIQTMALFGEIAHTNVVDYLKKDDGLYFVVECRNLRDIIGENGSNIKRIQAKFGQDIKVFKYSSEIKVFTESILSVPLKSFEHSGKTVRFSVDEKDKPIAIGRGGRTIKIVAEFLQRNFGVKDVKLM